MRKLITGLFVAVTLSANVLAGVSPSSLPDAGQIDIAELTAKIGSTMFAYYQFKYHDQVVVITTLKYCGNENMARKVAGSFPDLQSFYLEANPRNLLDEIIYKEAMVNGFDLVDEEFFEAVSEQSVATGQSYFSGYLKGYQIAMETFFDKKVMAPFCHAAMIEAEKYLKEEIPASLGR